MSRYELPNPKCKHAYSKRVIRVSSHADHNAAFATGQRYISAWICERPACLEDADALVRAYANSEPIHERSSKR